jgi:hypothetical protein
MSPWLIASLGAIWAAVACVAILLAAAGGRSDRQSEAALLRDEARRYRPRGLLDPEPVEEGRVSPPAPAHADGELQVHRRTPP